MSVFFIKAGLVTISTEQDVRHPVRRFAHLLTDHIQVNIRTAFDDQLIMNVTNNEAMPECLHGIAEDVTADSLYDVLHELRTVGFDAFPFLCGSDSFIGDGFAAILVFSDTGFHQCVIVLMLGIKVGKRMKNDEYRKISLGFMCI